MTLFPLRTCKVCGLEAFTSEELLIFKKNTPSKHGRQNICKQCENTKIKSKYDTDDKFYLRRVFNHMKHRCHNPDYQTYSSYGGRGISVCQKWIDNPETFLDWAISNGFERGLEIERINNNVGYSPENCTWVNRTDQNRNRRDTVTDIENQTRVCFTCGIEKPLTAYHRNKTKLLGRYYECKPCRRDNR